MEKTHCHCLSSFSRFCFFIGKSQQCSKQLHEYTDCFWQLPISKECVHAIPKRLFPWEFLVLNKRVFIKENTHTWTNSSCWLLLGEEECRGAGSHHHRLAVCPAGSHSHPGTSTYTQYGKKMRSQPMYLHPITQCMQGHLQTGLGRQL